MTPEQVDAMVASIPDDIDPEDRSAILMIAKDLRDSEIGEDVEQMYRLVIQAGGWQAFLDSLEPRTAGSATSGNFGHQGRPGKIGGSGPGGTAHLDSALHATATPITDSDAIGGNHVNPAWKIETEDGPMLFKPEEGETRYREDQIDWDNNAATLAEREVLAAEVGRVLEMTDLVPGAHMVEIAKAPPPVPPKTPFELTQPASQTPLPVHTGVIATTIGGLNAKQGFDAWGRPVWLAIPAANTGHMVEKKSASPSTPTPTSSSDPYGEGQTSGRRSSDLIGQRGAAVEWREGEPGYGSSHDGSPEDRARLMVFDTVIGNLDRHTGNYMMHNDKMISIDHGYAFPDTEMKHDKYGGRLISFVLDGPEPAVGPAWQKKMAATVGKTDWNEFVSHTNLSSGERSGVVNRAKLVVDSLSTGNGMRILQQKMMHPRKRSESQSSQSAYPSYHAPSWE